MSFQLDKKQVVAELVKCGKDPKYFISNYAKITHPQRGLIPFRLYDFQEDLIDKYGENRFNVILKARQLGISTITAAYVAWMMLFHREKNVLVIATKFTTAANLVKKTKTLLKGIPDWMKIAKVTIDNRTSFELSNGSQIKASSTSSDAGRSEALSLLVIDEAAHVEGLEDLWVGLYPTLSTGGRCIALSTPNGVGNWFHKIYTASASGNSDFYPTKLMWDVHPDRDQQWFEKETANMSSREIAQELQCNFNMSGETVFSGEDIDFIENNVRDPEYRTGIDRNLWIWKKFNPASQYIMAADVARGDGRDYSTFLIFEATGMEIVAEYRGKVTPDVFSKILVDAGREYGSCMMVVENNSVGYSVIEKVKELEYENIYHSIKSTHEYIDPLLAETRSNAIAGFTNSSKTRPLIIAKMEEFIRNKLIKVNSRRLLDEMKTFVWHNGRPEAMRSYNDDLIMACAIACWVRDTALMENKRQMEYTKVFLSSMSNIKTELNTTIPGQRGYKKSKINDRVKEHRGTLKKFPWLFD